MFVRTIANGVQIIAIRHIAILDYELTFFVMFIVTFDHPG